jgi:sodium/potassium/calcium exchanger 6
MNNERTSRSFGIITMTELERKNQNNSSRIHRQQEQKVARSFHHKVSLILTGCFLLSIAVLSVAFREERNDPKRFLVQSDNYVDYTSYSCNAIFTTTEAGSDNACRFAKTCNGGDGVFAPVVFCSSTLSYSTWCWILSPFLLLWMVILFRMLGSTAEDYLSPSLEMFSFKLGLPPRFAGVSLLAFGNGAADISATVNAITSDPNEGYLLSLGALSGSAMFIGCVVAGCVIVVAKGVPCQGALVRDVMALLVTVLVVFGNLLTGTIGPRAISLFITIYVVFIVVVLVADVYHRAIVVPRLQQSTDESEAARQMSARIQVNESAGDALNVVASERSKGAGTISIVLTALSNYDRNPDGHDGWGIDSENLEHNRPVHLHGRNGLLSSPEPIQRHEEEVLSPETQYRMVEDAMNQGCAGQPGAIMSTNWSGAWHDGIQEFKQHFITIWEDFMTDGDLQLYERILLILEFPLVAARKLSIPVPCEGYYCRGILAVSVTLSPLWFGYYLNVGHDVNLFWSGGFPWVLILAMVR